MYFTYNDTIKIMTNLTTKEMEIIMDNKLIGSCTQDEKDQVFAFAFGKKFMRSNNKGVKVNYKEAQTL